MERGHGALEDEAVAFVAESELGGLRGKFAIEDGSDDDDGEDDAGDAEPPSEVTSMEREMSSVRGAETNETAAMPV
jgi:hypothetical protein